MPDELPQPSVTPDAAPAAPVVVEVAAVPVEPAPVPAPVSPTGRAKPEGPGVVRLVVEFEVSEYVANCLDGVDGAKLGRSQYADVKGLAQQAAKAALAVAFGDRIEGGV